LTTQNDHAARLLLSLVPEAVRKGSPDELADRMAHAAELTRLSRAEPNAQVRKGYELTAQAVLRARPRAVVAQERATLIAKARQLGPSSPEADRLTHQAEQLLDDEPPAPRRAQPETITKALGNIPPGLQVAVFDSRGRFAGGVYPSQIARQVAKADAGKVTLTPVYDQEGCLVGVCDPDAITPVLADCASVIKAMKQAISARPGAVARVAKETPASRAAAEAQGNAVEAFAAAHGVSAADLAAWLGQHAGSTAQPSSVAKSTLRVALPPAKRRR
jgi:hypothetical protein